MTRIKNIADRIARQLGYLPASSLPNIEVTWESGQPPHVLIEPHGRGAWRNRVVGYVFPTLDGPAPGVPLLTDPEWPVVTLRQICPGGDHCICDSEHGS